MRKSYFGNDPLQLVGDRVHVTDAVVNEKDLAAPIQFTNHRTADHVVVPANDVGFDRPAFGRRRFQVTDITHADQRHVQRSRDRRRRQCHHIDVAVQRFESFFDGHAESLFFVDDDQAKVAEVDILAGQSMGADHDVDFAAT